MFWNNFYDKQWNFDNTKFLKLLEKSRKQLINKKKWKKDLWNIEINLFNSVSQKEVWMFINKLSIFINSWIDIKWAFTILIKQIKNPYLKKITKEIQSNIDYWISISETMRQYPKIFDNLLVSLISVWEKTWTLWRILDDIDKNMIENIELKWKVKWAMIYPIILLFLTLWMVTFMMVFIVPKITKTFEKTWTQLPDLTQFIVNISNFIVNEWIILLTYIISIILILKIIAKSYIWKLLYWHISLNIPIFWHIVRESNIIYFIKSFTILQDSWVLLLESLKISSQVVWNIHFKKEIIRIKNEVESWLPISKSLWLNTDLENWVYLNKFFPEEFAYVVSTWEETWSLSKSLKKIWSNYNMELKRYIWNLSTMLEPIIIVIVWILVWTIVVWIMLPFFEMWKVAKKM